MDTSANNSSRNPNPNSSKGMLAFHFMRALFLIQQAPPPHPSCVCRFRRIRRAAYASMAYSAGPRRSWSRALIRKLQSGARLSPATRRAHEAVVIPRRRIRVVRPRARGQNTAEATLRKLVPGGASMDYCDLLEEAVDYVRCLNMQVRLMRTIVDSVSS